MPQKRSILIVSPHQEPRAALSQALIQGGYGVVHREQPVDLPPADLVLIDVSADAPWPDAEALPGRFMLSHNKLVVRLVSQETTSGAVRLEDAKSGLLWIQIPAKSMLMNAKVGRRVVDACITPEQALASLTPDPTQPVVLDWGQPDPTDY